MDHDFYELLDVTFRCHLMTYVNESGYPFSSPCLGAGMLDVQAVFK